MNNQQQPQAHPNQPQGQGQIPDHRVAEMEQRLRQMELQNTQLRTTVDFLQRGNQNPQAQPQQSAFKPEVADAIKQLVNERLAPMETQYKQQIGFLVDQLDQAKYQLNYGNEKFKPYHDKVEQIRQQEIARGNFVPREEILRMVHFEETGKKQVTPQPQQQAAEAPKPPVFDPFFNTWVDPVTKMPVQPQGNQAFAPDDPNQPPQTQQQMPGQQQPVQQQFQPPAQQQNWQPQPQMQQPQQHQVQPGVRQPMQTQHPYGNAYGQNFGLPGQGVNNPATTQNQPNPRAPLDLATATEADLDAFERSFGEIPL